MGRPSHKDNNLNFSKDPSAAIEDMMNQYGTLVLRTAYFYLGDRHLAEDISQEVFILAYRNWTKFRGDSIVKTWLIKITINRCRDHLRLKRSAEIPSDTLFINEPITRNLEEEVIKRMNRTEILKHVLTLPLHYQEVLYLFYYLDFNTLEIAKATGDPEGTIRGRLHRARKLLGGLLEKEGFNK
ncbi:sigma-70 family RNA polymerase sigma factor [Neobacillus novalis]|uniref:Sigma-70 family RNA polymerase sigma factor n=1 Tax=Neobacillus novalis TaxID=220687 RepID=A0AA95SF21_9BACI|nr:sigma-70 family RNA polymerase sigma factor [Neobacillus novalis]WHY88828.1 sigma-70 family RNA polymerase sigma factor [Neobacillus novalis]